MLDGTRLLTSFGSAYGHLRDWDKPAEHRACAGCGTSGAWMPIEAVDRICRAARKR